MKEEISIRFSARYPSAIAYILAAWELIHGSRGDGISDETADHLEGILGIGIDTIHAAVASRKARGLPTSELERISKVLADAEDAD